MRYLHYQDLVERGIVANRTTLRRWILSNNFPKPVKLGPNTIAWPEIIIEHWLEEKVRQAEAFALSA